MEGNKQVFSFTKKFKIFAVISVILIVTGLAGLVLLPFGVTLFNLDIDFLGGVTMQYEMRTYVTADIMNDIDDIVLEVTGARAASIQRSGANGTEVVIKTLEISSDMRRDIFEKVADKYGLDIATDMLDSRYISAAVGGDLRNKAITAAVIAVVCMLVYITIRFEFRSGCAAVLALIHDVLVMLSIYIIFQIPMNMNFIAAALTILGYSINATIVIFDRVRENNKLMRKTEFSDIVDVSVRQTLGRSINTTITTLLTIGMVIILGVPSVRNFAIPLFAGILAGCYSSIFLSGPFWNLFRKKNA